MTGTMRGLMFVGVFRQTTVGTSQANKKKAARAESFPDDRFFSANLNDEVKPDQHPR